MALAQENLRYFEQGYYLAPSGSRVEFGELLADAVEGTRVYAPEELARLSLPAVREAVQLELWLSEQDTGTAAQELAREGEVALLNFASAKNPGGGFLSGAKAQEEDLARASGLYACLQRAPEYYARNRASESALYTDHLVYSPRVPFLRSREGTLLERPFVASVLTAPAPNRGVLAQQGSLDEATVSATLERRAGYVLDVAALHGHRTLVLGAWGCGVFRNDPAQVALAWQRGLDARASRFARVCMALLDKPGGANRQAFAQRFARRES